MRTLTQVKLAVKEMMRKLTDAVHIKPHEATHKVKLTELIREKNTS